MANNRNVLMAPSGVGMDDTVVATVGQMGLRALIIDARALEPVWKAQLQRWGAKADFVSPEKIFHDFKKLSSEEFDNVYDYEVVVLNVTTRGKVTMEAVSRVVNKAPRCIVRRVEPTPRNHHVLKGFDGPMNIISLVSDDRTIYPIVNENLDPARVKKYFGLLQ